MYSFGFNTHIFRNHGFVTHLEESQFYIYKIYFINLPIFRWTNLQDGEQTSKARTVLSDNVEVRIVCLPALKDPKHLVNSPISCFFLKPWIFVKVSFVNSSDVFFWKLSSRPWRFFLLNFGGLSNAAWRFVFKTL